MRAVGVGGGGRGAQPACHVRLPSWDAACFTRACGPGIHLKVRGVPRWVLFDATRPASGGTRPRLAGIKATLKGHHPTPIHGQRRPSVFYTDRFVCLFCLRRLSRLCCLSRRFCCSCCLLPLLSAVATNRPPSLLSLYQSCGNLDTESWKSQPETPGAQARAISICPGP